ncbi:MAG: sn-glycerol-3-phosphate ABC transporter ATP-binding protein UgpC [Synergistaceae bacterium]|jgi:multiple sugar transport system ATP-binding protein|nr:sn-glycerol-3-phosphate ABC transporter ATP-binding protein UgpC [Synergistaceae bacterium]
MARVVLRDFNKFYGDFHAVRDLNIEIPDREFAVLVGPSGCGKTTTLRAIAGLESVSSGEIWIGDRMVNRVYPKDRNIAMVFQSYALYPHMTVYENMAFGLKLRKTPPGEIRERVNEAASILGIEELLGRKPRQLSGGQRQRVAVGRAIVRKPEVFLFDEPLSNLDAQLRVAMRAEISKLHKRLGATVIYVTHDQVEAMTMATTMFVMKDGLLQQAGHPLQIYRKPERAFVAGFIGSPAINFFPLPLEKDAGGRRFLQFPGNRIDVEQGAAEGVETVLTGLRPEDFETAASDERSLRVEAIPEVVEFLGDESYVHFTCMGRNTIAKLRSSVPAEVGKPLTLCINHSRLHFFDASTGARLELATL